ncbi:hypothetical protein WMY93_010513 [Mugilogobius chulae]|uniref:Alpha 1,3-galactosyltransferase 2 n=1 Tax=Mugilogobius chulae TaxID=88201 RepID=A0AAW0PBD2_9GOBI
MSESLSQRQRFGAWPGAKALTPDASAEQSSFRTEQTLIQLVLGFEDDVTMRKLHVLKLCAVLTLCCFVFFFNNFKSIYFGRSKPSRVQAVNMSSLDARLNFSYLEAYLKSFIISAEKHLMIGLPVTYYIFTDTPEEVPDFVLGPERTMKVLYAPRHDRWQDISMMRMKTLSKIIESEISYKFPYVFCLDVDSVFQGRFGSEALSESVTSKAFMKTGDYYYHAALFGGTWQNVKSLVDFCYDGIIEDKRNNVEALWHDESHLNKFFWLHKPTKLLSPEYSWDVISLLNRPEIRVNRMTWAKKRYDVLRMSRRKRI